VLIVETSMAAGMLKSNEGGSAVLYGIAVLSNQRALKVPTLRRPTFGATDRIGCGCRFREIATTQYGRYLLLAISMPILLPASIYYVLVGRDNCPLSSAPESSPGSISALENLIVA
jgi:hypothetical protein